MIGDISASASTITSVVTKTLTGEEIGSNQPIHIEGLNQYRNKLIAIGLIKDGVRAYNVKGNKDIVKVIAYDDLFDLHGESIALIVQKNTFYIASGNVVQVKDPLGISCNIERLTNSNDHAFSYVKLVSNGEEVFSISKEDVYPMPGVKVSRMPDNKRMAFWQLDEKKSYLEHVHMATMVGNILVFGDADQKTKKGCNFYFIEMYSAMSDAEFGIEVKPKLLLKNAYLETKEKVQGNPITAVPREDLEGLINKAI